MAYMRQKEEVVVVGGLESGPTQNLTFAGGSIESLSSLAQSVLRFRSSDRTPLLKTTKLCR